MLKIRRRLDFAEKAIGADHCRELGPQYLHRDFAIVLDILGEVDCRHPARPELTTEAVPIGQCGRKSFEEVAREIYQRAGAE